MNRRLFIYGAGGFGKEVMDVARRRNAQDNLWSEICFLDDTTVENHRYGAAVYPFDSAFVRQHLPRSEFVIAVGEPAVREALSEKLRSCNAPLGRVIDTSAVIADSALLGEGVVVTPLCSISSHAMLGRHACINTMSIVGHDVSVGDHAVVSSMVNLGGACRVGAGAYLGMGTLIKEGLNIGANSIVGMGSVVYADIPDNVIALGNPARVARPNTDRTVFRKPQDIPA